MNAGGEEPLDYDALTRGGVPYRVTVTNARTGRPEYFGPEHMRPNDYAALKATACLPVIDRPYVVDGVPYFDGTISDPVPVRQAFADGCDKVVVIFTRPRGFRRKASHDAGSAALLRLRYPKAAAPIAPLLQRGARPRRAARTCRQGVHRRAVVDRRHEHAHA